MKRGLILDLDNTLYNWVDAFLPSFRAMTHKLSKILRLDEEEILADFTSVFKRYGTVEYPNAIEELALWDRHHISGEEKQKFVSILNKVFSINYKRNLRLFPHVREVLSWAYDEGIIIIGLSDALERWVCYRLRSLGVEKYFTGLYTWHHEFWFVDRVPAKSSIKKMVRLESTELKPNLDVINRMINDFSLDRQETFMVGDSISKDITSAQEAHIHDVWARYGTRRREKNLNTLRRITPWTESEKMAEKKAKINIVPTSIIDDFIDLINLIGSRRPNLFN